MPPALRRCRRALHPQGIVVASELLGAHGNIAVEHGQLKEAEPIFRTALDIAEHTIR